MGNQAYGASGWQAIRAFFTNYTNFSGRSSRREYWWWQLSATIVLVIVGFSLTLAMFGSWANLLRGNSGDMHGGQVAAMFLTGILAGIFAISTVIPHVALSVRRFRDAGVFWGWNLLLESFIVLSRVVPLPFSDTIMTWVDGFTLVALAIDVLICCLPSHATTPQAARGWRMPVLLRVQTTFTMVFILLTILTLFNHQYSLMFLLIMLNLVESAASQAVMREARNRAGTIWTLAKQLNLTPADLQNLSGRYTVADWADSRPLHLVFVPSPEVAWQLIATLQAQLKQSQIQNLATALEQVAKTKH